ncbi:hypothetical protein G9A89_004019 [Geosiphon pyriformis]|nr:hypothetical protein G9A89_004019 [Geosiphon pyriformis]
MCNVRGINVPMKQVDVVHWHVNLGNMVFFIIETKLRSSSGPWIKDKFDGVRVFSSGLDKGFMGAGVAIVMNTSLAHHVSKVEEIPGQIVSVRLLFKGKLSVTVLGLYAGASSGARFGQASEVNTLIAKVVNSSNFVVLGGDLNENGSGRSASFKFCLSLGLVNSFVGHYLANFYTWSNSRGVGKMIDYIFVGGNLSSTVAGHQVVFVSDFFDTDHKAVVVSVGLGGLLDVQLNSLRKQANKDHWKFKIRNADCVGWAKFKDLSSAKLLSLGEVFSGAEIHGDVDAMWAVLRLDPRGPVPHWFMVSSEFLKGQGYSFSGSVGSAEKLGLDILGSGEFSAVKDGLHNIWSDSFKVFTDGFLRNAGSAEVVCGAAAYFLVLDISIGVAVRGFLSSAMAKLQAVTLALECVPFSSTVVLCLDSQTVIDTCVSEMSLVAPDFRNQCWLERHHIFNLVRDKDLSVSWVKVKGHSGISGNVRADLAAGLWGVAVSGNAHHFVRDIFRFICCAHWKAGPGCDVVPDVMIGCIDWVVTAKVWHPDSHMLAGFTSRASSLLRTYVIKAVHRRLLVAIRKRLYDKCYPSVLCLFCGKMEFSDHVFTCVHESGIRGEILAEASARWSALAGGSSASAVLRVLSQCSIDVGLYTLVCKGFVLEEWYEKACNVFEDRKVATARIVDYVRFVVGLHRAKVWLARTSHRVVMKKAGLVCDVGVVSGLPCGMFSVLSDSVVRLLGLANSFAVSFDCRKPFCFFSGLDGSVQVVIDV